MFHGVVWRRLQRLLKPWLVGEPSVEVNLGVLNTYVNLANLTCDVCALNRVLLDVDTSAFGCRIVFDDVKVKNLRFCFSTLSVPAFDVEISGVSVVLILKKIDEEEILNGRKSSDVAHEQKRRKKQTIARIDPEGSNLHDVLESVLLALTSSRSVHKYSLLNTFFQQLMLRIMDIEVQLRLSEDDSLAWTFNLKEFGLKPLSSPHSIVRDFLGALLIPVTDISLELDVVGFELSYKFNKERKQVLNTTDFCASVKMERRQLANFNGSIRALHLELSPLDVLCLLKISNIFSSNGKHVRSGKHLWRIAATKLGNMISPAASFHKLVIIVCMWIRYLHAYEGLLLMLAHPKDSRIIDWREINIFKSYWEVTLSIEEELPLEAVVQARRMARYNPSLNNRSGIKLPRIKFSRMLMYYAWLLLSLTWRFFSKLFDLLLLLFFIRDDLKSSSSQLLVESEESIQSCFIVSCENLVVKLKSVDIDSEEFGKQENLNVLENEHINCFYLMVEGFWVSSIRGKYEQKLISCKSLKFLSNRIDYSISNRYSSKISSGISSMCGTMPDSFNTLLLCEPAMSSSSLKDHTVDTDTGECSFTPNLDELLRETCLSWQSMLKKSGKIKDNYYENPWLLFEVKTTLRSMIHETLFHYFWKIHLISGKLRLNLSYSSIISLAVLLGQMQNVAYKLHGSHARDNAEDQAFIISNVHVESYSYLVKRFILKFLQENRIEYALFIGGLEIEILMDENKLVDTNGQLNRVLCQNRYAFGFDIGNIEVTALPTEFNIIPFEEVKDNDAIIPTLKEGRYLCRNKAFAAGKVVSHRCNLRAEGVVINAGEKVKNDIVSLKPVAIRFSNFWELKYLLGSSAIQVSTTADVLAAGIGINLVVDELYNMIERASVLYSVASTIYDAAVSHFARLPDVIHLSRAFDHYQDGVQGMEKSFLIFNVLCCSSSFTVELIDVTLLKSKVYTEATSSSDRSSDTRKVQMDGREINDVGLSICLHQTSVEISCEENNLGFVFNLSNLRCQLFQLPYLTKNILCEATLCRCILTLCLVQNSHLLNSIASHNIVDRGLCGSMFEPCSSIQFSQFARKFGFPTDSVPPSFTDLFLYKFSLSEILMDRCSTNKLPGRHQNYDIKSFVLVDGSLKTLSWELLGGFLRLDLEALQMFVQSLTLHLNCIANMSSLIDDCIRGARNSKRIEQAVSRSGKTNWNYPDAFVINLSQLCLAFVMEDESRNYRELMLEISVLAKLEFINSSLKFVFDLSRLSLSSHTFGKLAQSGEKAEYYFVSPHESLSNFDGDSEIEVEKCNALYQSYLLRNLVVNLAVERLDNTLFGMNNVWVGQGSIYGFDLTMSLTEIKMILSLISSTAPPMIETTASRMDENLPTDDEIIPNFDELVPDGAVVAIQDVHEHLYVSVHEEENKYSLHGVTHYLSVGEKALFRVERHFQKSWKSAYSFSLRSLYAKNNNGDFLLLNYRRGSGIVDISVVENNSCSLWTPLSCALEKDKDSIEREISSKMAKRAFFLANNKNDCAVAFVNGILEFVKKPGNPFKCKIFVHNTLNNDFSLLLSHFSASQGNVSETAVVENEISQQRRRFPYIRIDVENIRVTFVHDVLDTQDKIPLLRCEINMKQLIMQVMSHKLRVTTFSKVILLHFDATKYMWRNFVHPVELCLFHRASNKKINSEVSNHGMRVHTHIKIKEISVALSELSLDVILFIIGILDVAGPFSVRSSVLLTNCCKIVNLSGLNISCQFCQGKTVKISRRQIAPVVLRHTVSENQTEDMTSMAIQVYDSGPFATVPLQLSLLKDQVLAWRTRIMSREDTKTYPGPVVIVEVSKNTEDGLSVTLSPSIRIYNDTELSLEMRVRRPPQQEDAYASIILKKGECVDDVVATFDSVALSGDEKKALLSLSLGNFALSFRPEFEDTRMRLDSEATIMFSDELKGEKSVRLFGILDKLSYKVRQALSTNPAKHSFVTTSCVVNSGNENLSSLHFLVQIISREVPITSPSNSGRSTSKKDAFIALQEQKEIFILPTVRVFNFLYAAISVCLTDTDPFDKTKGSIIEEERTIAHGSSAEYYVHPSRVYFLATFTESKIRCKVVNSAEWVTKLKNEKNSCSLDIDLDFGEGIHASLRLSRGSQGVLEAAIFTPYYLKNDSDVSFIVWRKCQLTLLSDEIRRLNSSIPYSLGFILHPGLVIPWFSRSNKVLMKIFVDGISEACVELSSLSGVTEIILETLENGNEYSRSFTISTGPSFHSLMPSQMVSIFSRIVLYNDSLEDICICPRGFEEEMCCVVNVDRKQKATLKMHNMNSKSRGEFSIFENIIKKHRNENYTRSLYIHFRLNKTGYGWSGPICTSSIGRFFLKFRKPRTQPISDGNLMEFAFVEILQEGATLGVHFHKRQQMNLPYLLENRLSDKSFTYYQKDSTGIEVLGSTRDAYYVWDDLTLPHKLVIVIEGTQLLREVSLNKLRRWKPLFRIPHHGFLAPLHNTERKSSVMEIGYEVYAKGSTRVLRICEFSRRKVEEKLFKSRARIHLRVHHFGIHMLEQRLQDVVDNKDASYTMIADIKIKNINIDCLYSDRQKYSLMTLQTINIDPKWQGAPYISLFKGHRSESSDSNPKILKVVLVLLSTSSDVRHVEYASLILQPVDLHIDEETLMRLASFWRTSLSTSASRSQLYYYDHFEIHPIKIIASFLPGETFSSYNSAQEMVRTLLHSVVKIPSLKNFTVELNGVLVTHALITTRELLMRCAQHYSWYTMRSIYIAKGSNLLPPAFASIFDDLASSSLDVFFDPSARVFNLSGATKGTLKILSKCIDGKGFGGTKRYIGDLGKTLKTVGSNILFAVATELSDSILTGAESNGLDGMVSGFHHGILKLAMEPRLIGTALMAAGPDRTIKLDRSTGIDELYIEGYLQAMLDSVYRQEYLRVKVSDDQVYLKNLPPSSALISEIMERVRDFLISKGLLKGNPSASFNPSRHLHADTEWKLGPTVVTLLEHLFVSFAIRFLRKRSRRLVGKVTWGGGAGEEDEKKSATWTWGVSKFVLSGALAYVDGRLCRCIPNPLARRIVSGYLLSFLDTNRDDTS